MYLVGNRRWVFLDRCLYSVLSCQPFALFKAERKEHMREAKLASDLAKVPDQNFLIWKISRKINISHCSWYIHLKKFHLERFITRVYIHWLMFVCWTGASELSPVPGELPEHIFRYFKLKSFLVANCLRMTRRRIPPIRFHRFDSTDSTAKKIKIWP